MQLGRAIDAAHSFHQGLQLAPDHPVSRKEMNVGEGLEFQMLKRKVVVLKRNCGTLKKIRWENRWERSTCQCSTLYSGTVTKVI